jgi:porin
VSGYIGGGVVYTGVFADRASDQAGLAINHAIVDPDDPLDPLVSRKHAETTVEATYRYVAKDWLSVPPILQFVHHPFGDLTLSDAFVIGVRLNFTLTKTLAEHVRDQHPVAN